MRTNMVIDESLLQEALAATGVRTKREVIELGLKTLIQLKRQEAIKAFRERLLWEGNLETLRTTP
jgi:Arc/MetJ family transcription regulator